MRRPHARAGGPLVLGLCLALWALAATLAPGLPGVHAAELKIEAPKFSLDRETNTYTYEDGRLTLGDLTLFASRMQVNTAAGTVRAEGYVRIETATVTGTASALELETATRVGRLHDAKLHDSASGLYLRAGEVRIHPDGRLELVDCELTACRPGTPGAWSITAGEVSLRPNGLGVAWNPRLALGPVPVLWLPVLAWPTVQERQTGLLPPRLVRHSSSLDRYDLGWRLQLPVFLNLGYDHDLTLTPEGIQKRGGALEAEYNYAFLEDQRGQFRVWGLRERDARNEAGEVALTPPPGSVPAEPLTRYRADWAHNQAIGGAGRLVLTWHHSSDGQVRREYDRIAELRPYRTYQASFSEQWDWLQTALTFEQNADFVTESVYAMNEADTDLGERPRLAPRLRLEGGGRLGESFPASLAVGVNAARFDARSVSSGRMTEISPTLSLPIPLGGAFELRPSLTRHFVGYTALTEPTAPDERYAQTEANLELHTAFARIFAGRDDAYQAVKHRMEPRLVLTYVEDVPQPRADQVLPGRVAQQLVTLRLDTTLLGRRAGSTEGGNPGPVRELLRVDLIQRYNRLRVPDAPALEGPTPGEEGTGPTLPQETEPGEPLLPLLLEMQAGWPVLSAEARFNWNHQLGRSTHRVLAFQLQPGARTRLGMTYHANEFAFATPDDARVPFGKAVTFDAAWGAGDTWTVGTAGRANLTDSPPLDRKLERAEVFASYHPRCYVVRVGYAEEVVPTVTGAITEYAIDRRVDVSLDLTGLVGGSTPAPPRTGNPAADASASAFGATAAATRPAAWERNPGC